MNDFAQQGEFYFCCEKPWIKNPPANKTETSQAAAKKIMSKTAQAEKDLLDWLTERRDYGATDHEIQAHFKWTGDFERPRRYALVRRGLVKASSALCNCGALDPDPFCERCKGTYVIYHARPTPSGNRARVWVRV